MKKFIETLKNCWKIEDPSVILVHYESMLGHTIEYIPPRVKIGISCLSMNEPTEDRLISSYIEQIIWMDKDKFEKHLKEEEAIRTEEQKATLSYLETELEISPIDNPYDYVKELQSRFDNSGIEYSDEYYDVLGIDRK